MAAWTDEMDATLKELWQSGMRALLIGNVMGKTKNAVIGRAHRVGCPRRENKTRGKNFQSDIIKAKKIIKALPSPPPVATVRAVSVLTRVKTEPVVREGQPVHFFDLKAHHCRAPMWDHYKTGDMYCGKRKKNGSSYCEEHHAKFTTKPPVRKKILPVEVS